MIGSFYPEVFHWTLGTPGLLSTRDLLTAGLLNLPQRGKGSQVSHGHLLLVIPEVMHLDSSSGTLLISSKKADVLSVIDLPDVSHTQSSLLLVGSKVNLCPFPAR